VWFSENNLVLVVAQALCIGLAGAGVPAWTQRFRRSGWVLVLPLSIAVVVAAIAAVPQSADVLTWVALILVPIGGALALGWAMRGGRPALAALAVPLLIVAWTMQDERAGELAALVLIAGSAITAGRLIAGVAPLDLLKAGVILMAVVDAVLVFSGNLEHPNDVLVAASPGAGLPQFQSASFNGAGLGYGDFFAAAVVGAIFAVERRPQFALAALMIAVALAWEQLFLVYDGVLPFTIPPALVLVAAEAHDLVRASRARRRSGGSPRASGAAPPSAARGRNRARRGEPEAAPARRAS
jgi:prepilin signal peptidase PulO-like enzyme (type II secretory pathway)